MMDYIKIENLEVYAYHGVFEEEKQKGQKFYINALLETNLKKAGKTDDLSYSTHYGEVCEQIKKSMTGECYDLIERAAEVTVEDILFQFPFIKAVTLEVRKPYAPIPMKFESVSVKLSRGWHKVYVAFGSNMGEKEKYIREAIKEIKDNSFFRNLEVSDFYCSSPYGQVVQDDFLNGVMGMETILEPYELLEFLHKLENQANRIRTQHWGPRTLDLDILFYDDLILDHKELQIPHKDMANRDFVLVPLAQIAGFKRHPVLNLTVEELVQKIEKSYIYIENGEKK